ncbi:MAG: hypothetical protein Q9173_000947 [Seirophora scorigena]
MAFAKPGTNIDLQSSKIFGVSHVVAVVTGGGMMELYNTGPGKIIPKKDEIKKLVDGISNEEPNGIQLLVNNAGIARDYATEFAGNPAPDFQDPRAISEHFWKSDPVSWQQNFTTNCMGGYFMSIAFLPLLARGCDVIPGYSSSVVNVTSNSAFLKNTTRGHISYGASKAAFVHLSRMLAHLFSQTKVRVNMIAPGTFPTEMTAGGSGPDQKSKLTRAVTNAVGRAGHEIDMAATILFLAGRGGTFYTAQTLFPDGGETLVEAASV